MWGICVGCVAQQSAVVGVVGEMIEMARVLVGVGVLVWLGIWPGAGMFRPRRKPQGPELQGVPVRPHCRGSTQGPVLFGGLAVGCGGCVSRLVDEGSRV